MTQLNDEVKSVVEKMMQSGELFTALDVSNKVKLALPLARHGEVRDIVRDLFQHTMVPNSWAKTPIQVTLPDGSQREALLYHPLSDSWDLDTKYDDQKRAQASFKPISKAAQALGITYSNPVPSVVTPTPMPQVTPTVQPAPVVNQSARDKWANLFNSQPSLFPRR